MGEAPRGPSVPEPTGGVAAVVGTSKPEPDKFVRPKHRRTSSLPSTMPSTSAGASEEEEGSHGDDEAQHSVTTSTTVATLTGADSSSELEGSSDEDEKVGKVSHANSKSSSVGALASSPKGKISFTGGRGPISKPSSMTNLQGGSLRNSKVHGQQQRAPPRPKGLNKAARFGIGERDSGDEGKRNKNEHSISWSRKSLRRAQIAKEYTTSESEDEVPDAKPLRSSQHYHPAPIEMESNSGNKTMIKVVGDSKKLPGHARSHARGKDDGNSSSDSETSTTTTTTDSDDEDSEEERDEHGAKRRRINSRKPSLHKFPTQVRSSRVKIADEDGSILASSGRENYRSDVESHDADHEHELWEEDQDNDTDHEDDRRILKMKRRNHGNSASFKESVSRNIRWWTVKTKIFYSFRARGNDSDDEGSKAISARNLAPGVNEQILQEFFGGCGAVTSVSISRDEFGRCSGSAYVEFDCGGAARKAVQKTGTRLLERVVFCDVAHETSTSRHVEPKTEPPPPATGALDIHSLLKAFHRTDNSSEGSVRTRPKKSKSSESLHFPRGLISPGDTITASTSNEQSVHDPNAHGESIGGGSKKSFFGLSRSSGTGSHSLKLGGYQSQVQTDSGELEQSKSQSREIEVQSEMIEVQPRGITQSRGIEFHTRSIGSVPPHSSSIPEIANREDPNEGLDAPPEGHNSKRKKWSFRKWHGKHRWVKMSWLKWVKKPRWHWWHFANLSARWGKASASTRQSVKTTPPPPPEGDPPEGYPRVSFKQSSPERSAAAE